MLCTGLKMVLGESAEPQRRLDPLRDLGVSHCLPFPLRDLGVSHCLPFPLRDLGVSHCLPFPRLCATKFCCR